MTDNIEWTDDELDIAVKAVLQEIARPSGRSSWCMHGLKDISGPDEPLGSAVDIDGIFDIRAVIVAALGAMKVRRSA